MKRVTSGFALVAVLAILAVLGALGTILAWTRPTKGPLVVPFTQSAHLAYRAQPGQGSVYGPTGLKTGEPIYLSTVSNVDLTYTYSLRSTSTLRISGTEQLMAKMNNGEGVTRSVQLQPLTHFHGAGFTVPATLPVSQLTAIAQTFGKGGVATGPFSVTISPSVKVHGTLAGSPFATTFSEPVHFVFGNNLLAPTSSPGAPAPGSKITASLPPSSPDFSPTAKGNLAVQNGQTAMLGGIPVKVLRLAAPAVLVLAAVAAALAFRRLMQLVLNMDERGRIALRHGSSIVEIDTLPSDTRLVVIGLGSFDGVWRIAKQLECPILHLRNGLSDDYAVVDNGTLYRYRVRSGRTRRVGRLVANSGESARHAAPDEEEPPTRALKSAGE